MDKKSTNGILNRIKYVKNIEVYLLVGLCLVLLLVYFSSGGKSVSKQQSSYTDEEIRLSDTLSKVKGVGEVSCMITYDENNKIQGVVIVAKGAKDTKVKIELINAACYALNIANSRVEVFEMK